MDEYIISMKNNLPWLQTNIIKDPLHKEPSLKKMVPTPKINIKGITLLDYFRMCQEGPLQNSIKEAPQESSSSKSSLPETPTFNHPLTKRVPCIKIKTDISQEINESGTRQKNGKCNQIDSEQTNRSVNITHSQSNDKNQKKFYFMENNPFKRKQTRKKIMTNLHYSTNKLQNELGSPLVGMVQAEENKNRMLRKIQIQKERVNDLRFSDAFIITKYGSKFRIDRKEVNKNQ